MLFELGYAKEKYKNKIFCGGFDLNLFAATKL
jgi:hypothetical protein